MQEKKNNVADSWPYTFYECEKEIYYTLVAPEKIKMCQNNHQPLDSETRLIVMS